MHNLLVDYNKVMEVNDNAADSGFVEMRQMMQYKKTNQKFQGINAKELLYTSNKFQVKAKNIDMEAV